MKKSKVKKQHKEKTGSLGYFLLPTPSNLKKMFNIYDMLIYTYLYSKHGVNYIKREHDSEHPNVDFNGFTSNSETQVFYLVSAFQENVLIDFKSALRTVIPKNIKINFYTKWLPHIINWDSPEMRARLRALSSISEQQNADNVTVYNMVDKVGDITRQSLVEDSLSYLVDADKVRHRSLWSCSMLIQIFVSADEDNILPTIEREAFNCGLKLQRVLYDIENIYKQFNPFAFDLSGNGVNTFVAPDEIYSRFVSYSQGGLEEEGFYFGLDVNALLPIVYPVKKNATDAENWIITAETGGGKSYFTKALLLQFIARGYNLTIMDIEGSEYLDLVNFIDKGYSCKVLNLGESSGKYLDPVAIPINADYFDTDAKATAVSYTLTILRTLMGKAYDSSVYIPTILEKGLATLYHNAGVTEDPKTWHLSEGLTLQSVYDVIQNFGNEKEFADNTEYEDALNCVKILLGKYFAFDGVSSYLFEDRLDIKDIQDADVLICSFGMAGKSFKTIDPIRLDLMQITAAQVSHQRSIYAKTVGKFNVKLWEEFQRWCKFPNTDIILGTAITGGRKLGDVNIVVTNVIKDLLENDTMGIIDNTNTFFCGAISNKEVRERFAEAFLMPELKDDLEIISGKKSNQAMYDKTFLCCFNRRDFALSKMVLPKEISDSTLFETGVTNVGN